MDFVRLVTVHPALVHAPLGVVPIVVLAYLVAWRRRSERWTFAGDVALAFAALVTLAAGAFGLTSFLVVDWPGGLGLWRWLHLATGIASTVLLATFAAVRLARRRRQPIVGSGSAWAAVITAVVVLGTGWIGGEVLVFHSGIAVKAAGEGALAPAVRDHGRPHDLETAMHRIRESWARITASVATMIVEEPSAHSYRQVADAAADLEQHARIVASFEADPATEERPVGELSGHNGPIVFASVRNGDAHAQQSTAPHRTESPADHDLSSMATELAQHAGRLEELARNQQLPELAAQLGETSRLCAHCHAETRWNEH